MNPRFNATVREGFCNRAGEFVHWVEPDKGAAVQVKYHTALPELTRVRLVGGRIEAVH